MTDNDLEHQGRFAKEANDSLIIITLKCITLLMLIISVLRFAGNGRNLILGKSGFQLENPTIWHRNWLTPSVGFPL